VRAILSIYQLPPARSILRRDFRKNPLSYQTPRLLFLFLLISEVLQLPKRTCGVWGCTRLRLVSHALKLNSCTDQIAATLNKDASQTSLVKTLARCGVELT
jgi:hypothetical protein